LGIDRCPEQSTLASSPVGDTANTCLQSDVYTRSDSADLAGQLSVSSREIPLLTPGNGTLMARDLDSPGLDPLWLAAVCAAPGPVHVVAARLGHADPSVTLRVYAHVIRDQVAAAADIFARSIPAGAEAGVSKSVSKRAAAKRAEGR
jgi:hypothetical protein